MAIDIEYNFTDKEKPTLEKDARLNLRITRCCGNCKFFIPRRNKGSRGYCKYPESLQKNLQQKESSLARCHFTMLCDLYQYKSYNTNSIGKWINKEFLNDGTIKQE